MVDTLNSLQPPMVNVTHMRVHTATSTATAHEEPSPSSRKRSFSRSYDTNQSILIRCSVNVLRHTVRIRWMVILLVSTLILLQFLLPFFFPPSNLALTDVAILRHALHRYRTNSRFLASHPRYSTFQTLASTYRMEWMKSQPNEKQPPVVKCTVESGTSGHWVMQCLIEAYFPDLLKRYPSLLQYRREDMSQLCNERLIFDIQPNPSPSPSSSSSSSSSAPHAHASPVDMFRSYLSYLGVAGRLGAEVLSSGTGLNDDPYWRWTHSSEASDWRWHKFVDESNLTTRVGHDPFVRAYDFGQWLANWQWDGSREYIANNCTEASAVHRRRIRVDQPIGHHTSDQTRSVREEVMQQLQATFHQLTEAMSTTEDSSPSSQSPSVEDRWRAFVSHSQQQQQSSSSSSSEATAYDWSPPSLHQSGGSIIFTDWQGPIFDPYILELLETRLWLRHTVHQLLHAHMLTSELPLLMPRTSSEALRARRENVFLTPQTLDQHAEDVMKAGNAAIMIAHGFDTNARPHPRENELTDKGRWRIKHERYDSSDVLNSYSSVFGSYLSSNLHWSIVIDQEERIRTIRTKSRSSTKIGVPIEYIHDVITFDAMIEFIAAIHTSLSGELQDRLILTIFFTGIGFREIDLEPIRREFVKLGIQARLNVNSPLAVLVEHTALSDIQTYFCRSNQCGMASFFRSEPIKLMMESNHLSQLYPYVRNVFRINIHDNVEANQQLIQNGAVESSQGPMVYLNRIQQKLTLHNHTMESLTHAIHEVYERKQHRLRTGGIPYFRENYRKDYPKERILIPSP